MNVKSIYLSILVIPFAVVAQENPNIIVFIADDCTFSDLGCYGGNNVPTPNIDAFSNEGILFNNAFQATAMSTPTRSNLYTGIYPVKNGAYPNHSVTNSNIKSIVQYLQPLGYDVALHGKLHVAPKEVYPFHILGKEGQDLSFQIIDNYLSMQKKKKENFCLFVCSKEPHGPFTHGTLDKCSPGKLILPSNFVDTQETRSVYSKYLAEVNYMDWQFGELLNLIEKNKLDNNTFIIFTSEQGNSFPFAKWTCYDAGLQTAFIIRWPSTIQAGIKSDALIEYTDIVPTLIEIAGGNPKKYSLDGKSFLPVLKGKKTEHKKFVYGVQTTRGISYGAEYYGIRTIRSKQFRYIINLTPEKTFKSQGTRWSVFKSWKQKSQTDKKALFLVNKYLRRPQEELYDIINDPFQLNNIADDAEFQEIKQEMKSQLTKWMYSQGDMGQKTELDAINRVLKYNNKKQL